MRATAGLSGSACRAVAGLRLANATYSSFKTLMAAARDAVASGDLTTAKSKLVQAKFDLDALEVSASKSGATHTLRQSLNEAWQMIQLLETEQDKNTDEGRRILTGRTNFG